MRGEKQQRIGQRIGGLNRRQPRFAPFGFRFCLGQCF
jgi:hypothetical protein